MSLRCKYCNSDHYVKNGFVWGKQRYKCKSCGYNFIEGDECAKYTQQDRLKVLKLYLENCGIRSIERLTGIHNSQISLWIERAAADISRELQKRSKGISLLKDIEILEMDALFTFIKKNLVETKKHGCSAIHTPEFGLLWIGTDLKILRLK